MFQVITIPDSLHMRQGAGTGFDSIGFIKQATVLTALAVDSSGTWLQVKEDGKGGKTGWCSARYVVPASAGWLLQPEKLARKNIPATTTAIRASSNTWLPSTTSAPSKSSTTKPPGAVVS